MPKSKPLLRTIGYEAASLEDFIATLLAANISQLVDVRELPISRRKGFAKTALSTALASAGIEYVHLKGLGDPKPGREAARRKDFDAFQRIFKSHMKTAQAKADLKSAAKIALNGRACLMCYESDHNSCHRTIVATAVCVNAPVEIQHLSVNPQIGSTKEIAAKRPRKSFDSRQGVASRRRTSRRNSLLRRVNGRR